MIPKLEELVKNDLVFIFGAGASMDYGFPSWGQLYCQLVAHIQQESESIQDEVTLQLSKLWLDRLLAYKDRVDQNLVTIDKIIADESKTNVQRNYIVSKIEKILGDLENLDLNGPNIAKQGDQDDPNAGKWIAQLSNEVLRIFRNFPNSDFDSKTVELLLRVKFISLNYERCFAHHFFRQLSDHFSLQEFSNRYFLSERESEIRDFFTVYQPHGSFGSKNIKLRLGIQHMS